MFLLVMHIPTYISQSASPVDFLNAETYVTILPLILSQFDDIFFPLLLGAGLALTLSLHLQWTQMQQIKLIDKISEKLAGFLKAIEVQTATEIKTEDPEKLATLQTEMQNHVENLRSQLSSLTEEAKLENDSAILKAEKTDDPQPN